MSFYDIDAFLARKNAEEIRKFQDTHFIFTSAPIEWLEALVTPFDSVFDVVDAYPGLTTIELFGEISVFGLEEFHKASLVCEFGQTLDGRWWTVNHNDSIREAYENKKLSPAGERFMSTPAIDRQKLSVL